MLVLLTCGNDLIDQLDTDIEVFNCSDSPRLSPKSLFYFWKYVRQQNPICIYSLLAPANFVSGLTGFLFRNPRFIWGIRSSQHTIGISRRRRILHDLLTRLTKVNVDQIICNSSAVADFAIRNLKLDENKIVIIPNLISIPTGLDQVQLNISTRKKLKIDPEEKVLLFVGRLVPDKDLLTLIETFNLILQKYSNARLVLAGEGENTYTETLVSTARNLGIYDRILWLGKVKDVWSLYSMADCFVSTSVSEGSSNSIREACLFGVPSVITNAGDAVEMFGFAAICEPRNKEQLAVEIEKSLSQRRDRTASPVLGTYVVTEGNLKKEFIEKLMSILVVE